MTGRTMTPADDNDDGDDVTKDVGGRKEVFWVSEEKSRDTNP
jgi:hypothetical protein